MSRPWGQAPRSRQGLEHPRQDRQVQGEPSSAGLVGGKGLEGATLASRCGVTVQRWAGSTLFQEEKAAGGGGGGGAGGQNKRNRATAAAPFLR